MLIEAHNRHLSSWSSIQMDYIIQHLTRISFARHLDCERIQSVLSKHTRISRDQLKRELLTEQMRMEEEDAILMTLWKDMSRHLPSIPQTSSDDSWLSAPPPLIALPGHDLPLSSPIYGSSSFSSSQVVSSALQPLLTPPPQPSAITNANPHLSQTLLQPAWWELGLESSPSLLFPPPDLSQSHLGKPISAFAKAQATRISDVYSRAGSVTPTQPGWAAGPAHTTQPQRTDQSRPLRSDSARARPPSGRGAAGDVGAGADGYHEQLPVPRASVSRWEVLHGAVVLSESVHLRALVDRAMGVGERLTVCARRGPLRQGHAGDMSAAAPGRGGRGAGMPSARTDPHGYNHHGGAEQPHAPQLGLIRDRPNRAGGRLLLALLSAVQRGRQRFLVLAGPQAKALLHGAEVEAADVGTSTGVEVPASRWATVWEGLAAQRVSGALRVSVAATRVREVGQRWRWRAHERTRQRAAQRTASVLLAGARDALVVAGVHAMCAQVAARRAEAVQATNARAAVAIQRWYRRCRRRRQRNSQRQQQRQPHMPVRGPVGSSGCVYSAADVRAICTVQALWRGRRVRKGRGVAAKGFGLDFFGRRDTSHSPQEWARWNKRVWQNEHATEQYARSGPLSSATADLRYAGDGRSVREAVLACVEDVIGVYHSMSQRQATLHKQLCRLEAQLRLQFSQWLAHRRARQLAPPQEGLTSDEERQWCVAVGILSQRIHAMKMALKFPRTGRAESMTAGTKPGAQATNTVESVHVDAEGEDEVETAWAWERRCRMLREVLG